MKNSSLGGKPTKPVVNVLPPGESTITVQWTQPFFSTTCDIAFGEDKNNLPKVSISSCGLWNIPKADLVPEKDYYIKVRGFNSLQDGDWSDTVVVRRLKEVAPKPAPAPVVPLVTQAVAQPQDLDSRRFTIRLVLLGLCLLIGMWWFTRHHGNALAAKSPEPTTVNYYFTAPKAPEIKDVWIVNTVVQPQPIQQQAEAQIEPPCPPEEVMVVEPPNPYYDNYDHGYSCGYPCAYSCEYSGYSRQPWVIIYGTHQRWNDGLRFQRPFSQGGGYRNGGGFNQGRQFQGGRAPNGGNHHR